MNSLHQHQVIFPLLSGELQDFLSGAILKDAFRNSDSDELVLVFEQSGESLSIQLNTEAKTGLFSFFEYPVDRKGSVFPLFKEIIGLSVSKVFPHQNNRSFQFNFGSEHCLVFKMYGPLCNVIYYQNSEVVQLFRSGIENDRFLPLDGFNQPSVQTDLPVFNGKYYVIELSEAKQKKYLLTFTHTIGKCLLETEVIFEALTTFSSYFIREFSFQSQKNRLLAQYKQLVKRDQAIVFGSEQFLKMAAESVPYDEIGHILMANIHAIKKGVTSVVLDDFYRNNTIEVSLKKELSPQDNAAYYYQKARNRKLEIERKKTQLEAARIKLSEHSDIYQKIEASVTFKELKPWIKEDKQVQQLPMKEKFRRFEQSGFSIYVGKNAKNNDELTLKFAHKDDLWLHARGVSGSHVIIKHQLKQNFPEHVIIRAAQIAAHYSSAAGSQLVPVIYTPKKYVRKPKGANAGQVAVEREEIMMVEPKL